MSAPLMKALAGYHGSIFQTLARIGRVVLVVSMIFLGNPRNDHSFKCRRQEVVLAAYVAIPSQSSLYLGPFYQSNSPLIKVRGSILSRMGLDTIAQ